MKKILFLGDLFYDFDVIHNDIESICEYIKENDYVCIVNLEGCLCTNSKKIKKRGPNLSQSLITIDILKKMNVIGVCLSNNHIMDYGDTGLKQTLKMLDEANILHTGAGSNIKEAIKPMQFKINNKIVNIYNFGWNVEETVYATKSKAGCSPKIDKYIFEPKKQKNILNIGIMHWGFEYNIYPMPIDITLAHKMAEKGYNLIIGHHPHVIQAKEMYLNKNIYYSLGNFYFASRRNNFIRKKFHGNIIDKCNYGLGVVFNPNSKIVEKEIFLYYDKNTKETIIKSEVEHKNEILPDITNINYHNKMYYRKVKMNKLNRNPILNENKLLNKIKINYLYAIYCLINLYKKIKQ